MKELVNVVIECTTVNIDEVFNINLEYGESIVSKNMLFLLENGEINLTLEDHYKLVNDMNDFCEATDETVVMESIKDDLVERNIFDKNHWYKIGGVY